VTPERRPEKLTRAGRLTRRPDYLVVQERGRRVSGSSYLLLALARPGKAEAASGARLGITVSKKVGKAVVRNQVKRWVRESYRRMSELAPPSTDLVVVARTSAAAGSFAATHSELRGLLRRLHQPGR
jgi:ribonuclease P protein component